MKTHSSPFVLLGICGALGLSACAVPDLEAPLSEFSTATKTAQESLLAIDAQVATNYRDVLVDEVIANKYSVKFVGKNDCQTYSPRCRIKFISKDDEEVSLDVKPPLSNLAKLMRTVRAYASSLEAIARADTAAKVEAEVNAVIGSIRNISKATSEAENQTSLDKGDSNKTEDRDIDISEYATPLGLLVNWLVGEYVAHAKLDALRRATKDAKGVIKEAAEEFGKAAKLAVAEPNKKLVIEISSLKDKYNDDKSKANLSKLTDAARKYNLILVVDAPNVFESMVQAHNALVDKIQDGSGSWGSVMAQLQNFGEKASELEEILQSLAEVSSGKKTGG